MDLLSLRLKEDNRTRRYAGDFSHDTSVLFSCAAIAITLLYSGEGIYELLSLLRDVFSGWIAALRGISPEAAAESYDRFYHSEGLSMVVSLFSQSAMVLIPSFVASKLLRRRPESFFPLHAKMPEKSGRFIFLTFGFCFSVNIVANLVSALLFPEPMALPLSVESGLTEYLMIVIFAPFLEEFFFRGVFLQTLMPYHRGYAILTSALVFGLMHRNPALIINAFVFGILVGIGFAKTGSMIICVVLHMANNALSLLTESLMSDLSTVGFTVLISLFSLSAVGFAVATAIRYFVSRKTSVFVMDDTPSKMPRLRPAMLLRKTFANPFFWIFAVVMALAITVWYFTGI